MTKVKVSNSHAATDKPKNVKKSSAAVESKYGSIAACRRVMDEISNFEAQMWFAADCIERKKSLHKDFWSIAERTLKSIEERASESLEFARAERAAGANYKIVARTLSAARRLQKSTGMMRRMIEENTPLTPLAVLKFLRSITSVIPSLMEAISIAHQEELTHTDHAELFNLAIRFVKGMPESKDAGVESTQSRTAVEISLDKLPADYSACFAKLVKANHAFRGQVAVALQSRLNKHLHALPSESYAEKQAIASWVNGQLRDLGLAIKCPKTGRPGNLVADLKEAGGDISRFRLEIREESGKRIRTISSRTLPELELIEDEPRQEPLLKWSQQVKREKADSKGKKGR
jgi:hypothetical protein